MRAAAAAVMNKCNSKPLNLHTHKRFNVYSSAPWRDRLCIKALKILRRGPRSNTKAFIIYKICMRKTSARMASNCTLRVYKLCWINSSTSCAPWLERARSYYSLAEDGVYPHIIQNPLECWSKLLPIQWPRTQSQTSASLSQAQINLISPNARLLSGGAN